MNDKHWAKTLRSHEQTPRPQAWERLRQGLEASQTDKIFAETLQQVEQAPRPEAWQRLRARLPGVARRPARWRWAIAAALLLLVGWGGYHLNLPETAALRPQQVARVQAVPTPPLHEAMTQRRGFTAAAVLNQAPEKAATASLKRKNRLAAQVVLGPASLLKHDASGPLVVQPLALARPEQTEVVAARPPQVKALPEPAKEQVFIVRVVEMPAGAAENQAEVSPARPRAQERKFFGRLAAGFRDVQDGNWEELGLDRRTLLTKAENSLTGKKIQ